MTTTGICPCWCRLDTITVPDLDELFGGRLNLAMMNPFASNLDEAPVSTALANFTLPAKPCLTVLNAT